MQHPGAVPDGDEVARRLASEAVVAELFSRIDAGDVDGAASLYAQDGEFLGARGPEAIRAALGRGIDRRRSRHLIVNVRSWVDGDVTVVEYTGAAFTLEGEGPYGARSVYDQVQRHRRDADGVVRIVEHRIPGLQG